MFMHNSGAMTASSAFGIKANAFKNQSIVLIHDISSRMLPVFTVYQQLIIISGSEYQNSRDLSWKNLSNPYHAKWQVLQRGSIVVDCLQLKSSWEPLSRFGSCWRCKCNTCIITERAHQQILQLKVNANTFCKATQYEICMNIISEVMLCSIQLLRSLCIRQAKLKH